MAVHRGVMIGFLIPSGRSRFRTGGRKINANDYGFVVEPQVDISITDNRMMRIGENIHATYPQYATVAPILHKSVRNKPIDRSTTFNQGAADADGR